MATLTKQSVLRLQSPVIISASELSALLQTQEGINLFEHIPEQLKAFSQCELTVYEIEYTPDMNAMVAMRFEIKLNLLAFHTDLPALEEVTLNGAYHVDNDFPKVFFSIAGCLSSGNDKVFVSGDFNLYDDILTFSLSQSAALLSTPDLKTLLNNQPPEVVFPGIEKYKNVTLTDYRIYLARQTNKIEKISATLRTPSSVDYLPPYVTLHDITASADIVEVSPDVYRIQRNIKGTQLINETPLFLEISNSNDTWYVNLQKNTAAISIDLLAHLFQDNNVSMFFNSLRIANDCSLSSFTFVFTMRLIVQNDLSIKFESSLKQVSFTGTMAKWQILQDVPLAIENAIIQCGFKQPFDVKTVSGSIQGSASIGSLQLPHFIAYLPFSESGLSVKMLDKQYTIPAFDTLAPLVGLDLGGSLPSPIDNLSALNIEALEFTTNQELSGFYSFYMRTLPAAQGAKVAPSWPLIPGSVSVKDLVFDFSLSPAQFRAGGNLILNRARIPITNTNQISNDGTIIGNGFKVELGALPGIEWENPAVRLADFTPLGANLADILSDLDQIDFLLNYFSLRFNESLQLETFQIDLKSISDWIVIPNKLILSDIDFSLGVTLGANNSYKIRSTALFRHGVEGLQPIRVKLDIPENESRTILLDLDETEPGYPVSDMAKLSSLSGVDVTSLLPPDFPIEFINITQLEIVFSKLSPVKIERLFLSTRMSKPWQLQPEFSIEHLKLHVETDFTANNGSSNFQISGVIFFFNNDLAVSVTKAPSTWVLELEPYAWVLMPLPNIENLPSVGDLQISLPQALKTIEAEIKTIQMIFSDQIAFMQAKIEFESHMNEWQVTPTFALTDVDLDMSVVQIANQEVDFTGLLTATLSIGEKNSVEIPMLIEKTNTNWKIGLNQERLYPKTERKITLPFANIPSLFKTTLDGVKDIIPLNDVTVTGLDLVFSKDMGTWESADLSCTLNQSWTPFGTFALEMKNINVHIDFPLSDTERSFSFTIAGTVSVDTVSLDFTIDLPQDPTQNWVLSVTPPNLDGKKPVKTKPSVEIASMEKLSALLNQTSFNDIFSSTLTNCDTDLQKVKILFHQLTVEFSQANNDLQKLNLDWTFSGASVSANLPYNPSTGKPQLDIGVTLNHCSLTLDYVANSRHFGASSVISFSNLPPLLKDVSGVTPPWTFDALFEVSARAQSETKIRLKILSERNFNVPGIDFMGQTLGANLQMKDLAIEWPGPVLMSDIEVTISPDPGMALLGIDLLKDNIPFLVLFDTINGFSITPKEWPLSIPYTYTDAQGWTHVLAGKDENDPNSQALFEIKTKLPKFSYNGEHFIISGETYLVNCDIFAFPLGPIKNLLNNGPLSFLADVLPGTIDLVPGQSNINLPQDEVDIESTVLLPGTNSSRIPADLKEYLKIKIPEYYKYDIQTYGKGSLRFDISLNETDSLRIMLPLHPLGIGANITRVAFGNLGGNINFDFDGEIDIFNLLLINIFSLVPVDLPFLADPETVRFKITADRLSGMMMGSLPVPTGYEKLAIEYSGYENLGMNFDSSLALFDLNDLGTLFRAISFLHSFVFDPKFNPTDKELKSLAARFSLVNTFVNFESPIAKANLTINDIVSTEREAFNILKALKKLDYPGLLAALVATPLEGSATISFGPLSISIDGKLTTMKQFKLDVADSLHEDSTIWVNAETASDYPNDQKAAAYLYGDFQKTGLADLHLNYGLLPPGNGAFGEVYTFQGSLGGSFLTLHAAGYQIISMDVSSPYSIFGEAFLSVSSFQFFAGTFSVSSEKLYFDGRLTFLKTNLLDIDHDITGELKSNGNFLLSASTTTGGYFPINASATVTNTSVKVSGTFSLIENALLRLAGDVTVELGTTGLSLLGNLTGGTGLFGFDAGLTVEGKNLATVNQFITLSGNFNFLNTPLLKIGGTAAVTLKNNGVLNLAGSLNGSQKFLKFDTSGAGKVTVSSTNLGTSGTSLNITGKFGIDTGILNISVTFSGTLDATPNCLLTGRISACTGAIKLKTSGSSVTVSKDTLSVSTSWLGLGMSINSLVKNSQVVLTANASYAFDFDLKTPDSWKIPNPLVGGADIDLSGLGINLSVSAAVEMSFSNLSESGFIDIEFIFGPQTIKKRIMNINIAAIKTLSDLKNVIIDFIKGLNLFEFLSGAWLKQLIDASTFMLQYMSQYPIGFNLLGTDLFSIKLDIDDYKNEGGQNALTASAAMSSPLLKEHTVSVTVYQDGITIPAEFAAGLTLPGTLGFELKGDLSVGVRVSGYDLSGSCSLWVAGQKIFSGDIKNFIDGISQRFIDGK